MADAALKLAVRDFALPCPRRGSIDAYSGYSRSALDGIEIHQAVQAERKKADPAYEAEVPVEMTFLGADHGIGYDVSIQGRIDGLVRGEEIAVEEIKSTFNLRELLRVLEEEGEEHPYVLQLLTYGYCIWKQTGILPTLSLHVVSSRNCQTADLPFKLDIEKYEAWLKLRLSELEREAKRIEKRIARRRRVAADFPFPFDPPRAGQLELVAAVAANAASGKRLMVQAPTGLGKTAGVLYPSLKESLSRGQRTIYVTPKNSQHAVAEDAVRRFQDSGTPVKSLTLTAKGKICFKAEPLCNPKYCEYAKDYYAKVAENDLPSILEKKRKLTAKTFRKLGEEYEICPYQLQLDAIPEADVVIGDYFYVFSSNSALGKLPVTKLSEEGEPNLVVDEAHNLPGRAMDYFSPTLSSFVIDRMREEFRELPLRFYKEGEALLEQCLEVLTATKPKSGPVPGRVELDPAPFLEVDGKLRAFLTNYLESEVEIEAKDVVLRLCFYWGQFTEILEEITVSSAPEFFTTYHPEPTGGAVKITCCDASKMIAPRYDEFNSVVAFSATLKPFEFYARLSGLSGEKLETAEFESPFIAANRKLLLIPQISTKYSERERNYAKIAETIQRISELRSGNYLAFFPSFEFMRRVGAIYRAPPAFRVRFQEREMRAADVESVLDDLRAVDEPTLFFAVQGGVFSEGVDYPGEMVVGAFIVGAPLPSYDIERETMRKYYDEHYGEGFEYAYTYPAMAKAVQAAGRVIRSETDRGVIVLMDRRFTEAGYSKSMPRDWFKANPTEMVSRQILSDVSEFWSGLPKPRPKT